MCVRGSDTVTWPSTSAPLVGIPYTFLGLALLWLAPLFHGTGLMRWTRWSLLANGIAVVPIVLTYFVDRAFIAVTGPLWAIAIPACSVLLAMSFRRLNSDSEVLLMRRERAKGRTQEQQRRGPA